MRRILMTLLASVAFAALADKDVDETRSVPNDSFVEIVNVRGEINVRGWDRDEVRVQGELDDLAEELVFEVQGKRVLVEVRLPGKGVNWGDGSDLTIDVPRFARVDVKAVSADVEAKSVFGGLRVRTVSGDVNASDLDGQLIVNTVSGEIEIRDARGDGKIKTVSGEIDIEGGCDSLVLDTVSGEIDVDLMAFSSLRVTAINGDVDMEGELRNSGEIDMNSVNGDLKLELRAPVDAIISVMTGPGGDIKNSITDTMPKERFPASKELETVAGDGGGRIKLRTVNGDIEIKSDG